MPSRSVLRASLLLVVGVAAFGTTACTRSPVDQSCAGAITGMCPPYAYATVQQASLDPSDIQPGNPMQRAHVHVVLQTCGQKAPSPARVEIFALAQSASGLDEAGPTEGAYDLTAVHDDGANGDMTAKDGIIDVMIDNPFFSGPIPPDSDIHLRFEPHSGASCVGGPLEIPYHTGATYVPVPPTP